MNPALGDISDGELQIRYERTDHDSGKVKHKLDKTLNRIRQYLGWFGNGVSAFNQAVFEKAMCRIELRR